MARERLNCWEYMKCGRQLEGDEVAELGICPAATDTSYDGINFGKNAGRFCWAVAGTLCDEQVQGTFAEKRISCISCDFFKLVQQEEGASAAPTRFLSFFSENEKSAFLKEMTYKHIAAGERFITQGQAGDVAFIIQRGSCLILVEKNRKLYPTGHRGVGDIVGEAALLTGEPRSAHVEAQTDLEVWVLSRAMFDNISNGNPELMEFLTEIVADRFESSRLTAERKIGRYVVTDIIGHGGFSIIYKGVHASLNMPVAIKMLKHDLALRPEFIDRLNLPQISRHTEEQIMIIRNRRCVYAKKVRFRVQVRSGSDGRRARSYQSRSGKAAWNWPRRFIALEARAQRWRRAGLSQQRPFKA